jgi:hypothetical protein
VAGTPYVGWILDGLGGAIITAVSGWLLKRRQDPRTKVGQRRVRSALELQIARLQEIYDRRLQISDAQHTAELERMADQYRAQITFLEQQIRRLQRSGDDQHG